MAERVVLHVGLPKSGTSHLQHLLYSQRERLAADGVGLPGETWGDVAKAVRQLVSHKAGGPKWDRLVAQVRDTPGTSVVSMEFLAAAPRVRVEQLLADLGVAAGGATGAEACVVVTARDLNRTLVSSWQEAVQNGSELTWAEYAGEVARGRPGPGGSARSGERGTPGYGFWRRQGLARVVGTWTDALGTAERVRVVTAPPAGGPREALVSRFAEAAGLDVGPVPLAPPAGGTGTNESVGLTSVLALRELNVVMREQGWPYPHASHVRKHLLAKGIMAARRGEEPRLGASVPPWMPRVTRRMIRRLEGLGAGVVGDLADLEPQDVPGVDPDAVPDADVHAATTAALAGLVTAHAALREGTLGGTDEPDDPEGPTAEGLEG